MLGDLLAFHATAANDAGHASFQGRDWLMDPTSRSVNILGRTKPGVDDRTAQATLDAQFSTIVRATVPLPQRQRRGQAVAARWQPRSLCAAQAFATPIAVLMIYGLMAYSVAQRTREIGIRMALGAIPRQILSMVLRESCSLSAAAIALGVATAIVVTRVIKSLLFGIAPSDPAVLCGATALLMFVAVGASWLPARRASTRSRRSSRLTNPPGHGEIVGRRRHRVVPASRW